MDTEIELKFLLSDNEVPLVPGLLMQFAKTVNNKPTKQLQNAYFDTPERHLRKLDIGLRTRCCNDECEQTIKLAGEVVGGLHQRPEYNLPIEGGKPNIALFDASIWPTGMDMAFISANLQPIFSTNFTRRKWLIETENGSQLEVVLDKGEVTAGNQSEPISELEVELIEGDRSDVFAFAEHLISQLGVRLGLYSKAARGYRMADNKPLIANKALSFVPLSKRDTQEQALEESLGYAIRFVQKHEQCYFDEPKLKTLKRMLDGISLIRHIFWLFDEIVEKEATEHLRKELKWLLGELSWVENAMQLKTYTSKRHAYYKKINNAPELAQVITDLQDVQPSETDMQDLFHCARYNRLLLALTRFLLERTWRKTWNQKAVIAAEKPIVEVAAQLFERDWQQLKQMVLEDKSFNSNDYLQLKPHLENTMLNGNCLGSLFDKEDRRIFRTPWLDILYGVYELQTLSYLKQLCVGHGDEQLEEIQKWLEQKANFLVTAMEQSRVASLDNTPYWR
ncbi:CYTH domain-containing protein [Pseudoalteromonas xiamenensis]|uniref:CYTH and CHAD domain-containing protein n=1 Tax=Pseudoalteromonas xiamenensis TaxID=882626 RepID=A0A975DFW1_9GAMM|nr:CYTH domain-containing protein [Pseudoalteromonas xiamenensis]QTH70814.1 CYTH and CHAD domain-containing protein [Pseudoalteromonas xiamenensis]